MLDVPSIIQKTGQQVLMRLFFTKIPMQRKWPRLGIDFAEEIYAAIARICEYPDAWSALSSNTRRCIVSRFPYGVIFQVKAGVLRVIAVANLHRRPGYWMRRTETSKKG